MAVVSRLALQPSAGDLMVHATINHLPALFIFDTGAQLSVITPAAADRLGMSSTRGEELKNAPRGTFDGIGGARSAISMTAHSLELGGMHARDYNILSADVVRAPADGLLSLDVVANYDIDLDLPEGEARLFRAMGDCSAPTAFLEQPLYVAPLRPTGLDPRPRVEVTIGDHTLIALVDTGAAFSAIFRRAASRIGIKFDRLHSTAGRDVHGIGPRGVHSVEQAVEPVSVGDLTFEHMRIAVLDQPGSDEVDMILGADFLRQVHVWISYSSHSLIMQYPPRPSKRLPS